MPKLWDETIEAHRQTVRDAILDAAAQLVARDGLRAVTMSAIAERTGIGRATLYKYFPDVESVLVAWHEREVGGHLQALAGLHDASGTAGERLRALLDAYAQMHHDLGAHGGEIAAMLHRGEHIVRARDHLHRLVRKLIEDAAAAGEIRSDVPASELAHHCLHSLAAASALSSKAAVARLVTVTFCGLLPTR